jgi:hypothetical protein
MNTFVITAIVQFCTAIAPPSSTKTCYSTMQACVMQQRNAYLKSFARYTVDHEWYEPWLIECGQKYLESK